MLPENLQRTLTATAGRQVNFTVTVFGRPKPVVSWSKSQSGDALNERFHADNIGDSFTLIVDKCNRYDAGQYVVSAQNSAGVTNATITLRVLGLYIQS